MKFFKKLFVFILLFIGSINLVFAVRETKYARVVFLGNFASGKTAFLNAIQGKACNPLFRVPTQHIEADKLYTIQDESNDRTLILLLEDYPGEECLHDQLSNYYKDAHIVCICVPLDEQIDADNSMTRWINEAANRCRTHFLSELGSGVIGPNVYPTLFIIVGTKLDRVNEENERRDHTILNRNRRKIEKIIEDCDIPVTHIDISSCHPNQVQSAFNETVLTNYDQIMNIVSSIPLTPRGQVHLNLPTPPHPRVSSDSSSSSSSSSYSSSSSGSSWPCVIL